MGSSLSWAYKIFNVQVDKKTKMFKFINLKFNSFKEQYFTTKLKFIAQ